MQDLDRILNLEDHDKLAAGDIITRSLVTAYPDETIGLALEKMGPRDLSSLPVIDPDNARRLLGIVRRPDIVRAYNLAIVRQRETHRKLAQTRLENREAARFFEFEVAKDSSIANRAVSTLSLPRGCVIISIQRDGQTIIPRGDTVLAAGDQVTAFVKQEDEETLRQHFSD